MKKNKKIKLKELPKIKKELDALWAKKVRERDKKCLICGKLETLQAHHFLKSRARSIKYRWDMRNGITLCYTCHLYKIHTESSVEMVLYLLKQAQINEILTAQEANEIIYNEDCRDYSKDRAFLEGVREYLEKE